MGRKLALLAAVLAAAGILAAVAARASAGGTPWIRATPVPEQNLVRLEWGMEPASETGNYNYMVYKREAGEAEFQSIPVKDKVKVLNIYPPVGENITFTNWKGQRFTLPKAASLKRWMEEPNAEHPRGYGMGLIDVDAVPIPDFNANPAGYLKNPDGSWKYDVIFNGSWDVNAGYDLNANSLPVVEQFIKSGRGYLTGHDTMFGDQATNVYTRKLRRYFRIKVGNPWGYWDAFPGEIDYKLAGRNNYPSWIGSTTVKVARKGLLTNYPWRIGEPGTILHVPFSHSTSQYVFGDVWLTYTNDSRVGYAGGSGWQYYEARQAPSYVMNPGPPDDPDDPGGTNNFYLATWSNTAMINTGHSNCEATPDEQKIIANALFYLAQVTEGTSWDDRSAQDVAPPDPVAGIQAAPVPGGVEISWQRPKDNGNAYYYYVQAVSKATGDRLNSAAVGPVSYATGVKGYAYIIDQNPDTDPGTAVNLTRERVAAALAPGKYYLHIRAVDNAGNASEVRHFVVGVGFELRAALEPNPAMRGQKVRLYATVLQSGLNTGTQVGEGQEFHLASRLVQHRDRPSFWQPWGTDFTDPYAWWIWSRDIRSSNWQALIGETAEFRETWFASAWSVYRTEVVADNWFHLYQDGNLVLKGGGLEKTAFIWEQGRGEDESPYSRKLVSYRVVVGNGGGPAGLLLSVREVGRHWTIAYQPYMPGDGVSHRYFPEFYIPYTQTVTVRVRDASGNPPYAVYIDDLKAGVPGVVSAFGGDLTFIAQGGHWYQVNVLNSYSKGVDRFDVRVSYEGEIVAHTNEFWETRNLPIIGYGNAVLPVATAPGAEFTVNVPVRNLSGAGEFASDEMNAYFPIWEGPNYGVWNHVQVSYHWYDQSGNCVVWDGLRTELPQNVPPGGMATVPVKVQAPIQPGVYTLRVDAVQDGIAWFSWAAGPVLQGQVRVDPSVSGADYSGRIQADQAYAVLPNGARLTLQWDDVLRRYWGEFLIPDGGSPGAWPGDGSYAVRVAAVKNGLENAVPLTLVVQGNVKERLYIRTLEW